MIGVLDSGFGGLWLVRELRKALPHNDILFLGDTLGGPYESKSPAAVTELTRRGIRWLQMHGAQLIVPAAEAAAVAMADGTADRLDEILLDVVTPAIEAALRESRKRCLGVLGAAGDETGTCYTEHLAQIEPQARMYYVSAPLLIPLLENRWDHKPEARMIVKKYLHPVKTRQIDSLLIANPYHELLQATIQRKIGRRVKLVSAATAAVDAVKRRLVADPGLEAGMSKNSRVRLCVSDLGSGSISAAKRLFGGNVHLESIKIA